MPFLEARTADQGAGDVPVYAADPGRVAQAFDLAGITNRVGAPSLGKPGTDGTFPDSP